MTDLFEPTTPPNPAAVARKCLHPRRDRRWGEDGDVFCTRCGAIIPADRVTRGRRSRNRGNAIERGVAAQMGLRRVGQFGGPTDVGTAAEPFRVSVKSGSGYFSERYWDQLRRQDVSAGQTALLVVTDAPGPGRRRRAMVVLSLDDWLGLHGPSGVEGV